MSLKTVSVDIAFDGFADNTSDFLSYLQEVCEVFNLQIVGLIPVGSAGAWPEVTFRGKEEDLIRFCIMFFQMNEDGEEYYNDNNSDDSIHNFYVFSDERFTTKADRKFITNDGKWIDQE
jgi:hypothetical protein